MVLNLIDVFKGIATMEKFTDVPTNVLLEAESSTGMFIQEALYVENVFI